MWGCIAVGLFAEPSRTANAYSEHGHYGLFYGIGGNLLGAQGAYEMLLFGFIVFADFLANFVDAWQLLGYFGSLDGSPP